MRPGADTPQAAAARSPQLPYTTSARAALSASLPFQEDELSSTAALTAFLRIL